MLNDPTAVTKTLFGQEILVNGYFVSVLGVPALNMGVFVGIISGFVGGIVYNKYYNFRKLPDVLSFFNGKRFVPMAVIFYSLIISLILSIVWPVVQLGINNFGVWIANSAETSPISCIVCIWYARTTVTSFRSAPYAYYTYELYIIRRYVRYTDGFKCRKRSFRSRPFMACMGN